MELWTMIHNQEDADALLQTYGGFHDSCLVESYYRSGAFVDEDSAMHFGSEKERELHLIFHSQWKSRPLDLCFTGVRTHRIAGWSDLYDCCFLDGYLKFHTDLIPGRDDPLIVWADGDGFSPHRMQEQEQELLTEPMTSYVVASGLKWRYL